MSEPDEERYTSQDLNVKIDAVFEDLRQGRITIPMAKELFNGAGKMIACTKLDMEYAALKHKPYIPFIRATVADDQLPENMARKEQQK